MRIMPDAEVTRKVLQLDNDVRAIYEMLAGLDQGMRTANGALLRHGNRLDSLDQRVDSLDQKVGVLDQKVDSQGQTLDTHGQKLDEILDILRGSNRSD